MGFETRERRDARGVAMDLRDFLLVDHRLYVVLLNAFLAVDGEILPRLVVDAVG